MDRLALEPNLSFLDNVKGEDHEKFHHSGYASRKVKNKMTVENNSIKKTPIPHNFVLPHDKALNPALKALMSLGSKPDLMKSISQFNIRKKIEESVNKLYKGTGSKTQAKFFDNGDSIRPFSASVSSESFIGTGMYRGTDLQGIEDYNKATKKYHYQNPSNTVVDVRCMLHPGMSRDTFMKHNNWIPGQMNTLIKTPELHNEVDEDELDNLSTEERVIRVTSHKRYFRSKINQYDIKRVEDARNKPTIRCSSAYLNDKQKELIELRTISAKFYKKNENFNIKTGTMDYNPVDFYTVFQKTASDVEKNHDNKYLNKGFKYRPVSEHKFRKIRPKHWVTPYKDFKKN